MKSLPYGIWRLPQWVMGIVRPAYCQTWPAFFCDSVKLGDVLIGKLVDDFEQLGPSTHTRTIATQKLADHPIATRFLGAIERSIRLFEGFDETGSAGPLGDADGHRHGHDIMLADGNGTVLESPT